MSDEDSLSSPRDDDAYTMSVDDLLLGLTWWDNCTQCADGPARQRVDGLLSWINVTLRDLAANATSVMGSSELKARRYDALRKRAN